MTDVYHTPDAFKGAHIAAELALSPRRQSSLAQALAAVQAEIPTVIKSKTAKVKGKTKAGIEFDYTYKYADLADVTDAILPLLGKHGLAFTCQPTIRADEKFGLAYRLMHASGELIDGFYPLDASMTPQQIGGHITYARRYCLCAITGIAAEEDTDAREAETAAQTRTAAPKGRRQPPPERAPDALPRNRDGGISRSQATDDELAAAGNMTDAQLRDHNRLEREVKGTGPQGTQRLTATPDDDPWQLPAPAPARPIDSRIVRHFERFGITDKDVRLGYTATLAGRDDALSSTKDLTAQQAMDVLQKLASCKDRAAFDELMGASP